MLTGLVLFSMALFVPVSATAISDSCLPGGFPSTPTPLLGIDDQVLAPAVHKDIARGVSVLEVYRIDVWRVKCQDGTGQVALLLRATPITSAPKVCDLNLSLIQGGMEMGARLFPTAGSVTSFCDDLLIATTFSLEAEPSGPILDNKDMFLLDVHLGGSRHISLDVPAVNAVAHTDFDAAVIDSPPLSWVVQGMGDFNGDGKADIVWREVPSGAIGVWLMDGVNLTAEIIGYQTLDWTLAGVGDFNGDGKADILLREVSSGAVIIWFMDGVRLRTTTFVASPSSDWTVAGVGDVDGDGRADILWRQSPSGSVGVWFMDVFLE
jgi:hypothetical protein